MKLLAPAIPAEVADRILWFEKPEAKRLAEEKKVELGIEIKGPLSNIKKPLPFYWGIHLPVDFATTWHFNPSKRRNLIRAVKKAAKLKPDYAVLHGIDVNWTPPAKNYVHRYVNPLESAEYLKLLRSNTKLINELKSILPLKIENGEIIGYYWRRHNPLPYTHLFPGLQRLDDVLYLKKRTRVGVILDLEHLILSLNFLNRQKNYSRTPVEKITDFTSHDQKLKKIVGYNLKKYFIPYLDKKIDLAKQIKKYRTNFFHINGNNQDVIFGKKVLAHGTIDPKNKTFRKNFKLILAQKPEVIVIETANSKLAKAWNYMKPNETEISFLNMCKILQEEL